MSETAQLGHGKTRYEQGCRCPICCASWTSYNRQLQRVPQKSIEHGRSGYTNHHCRCAECRAAWTAYKSEYRENARQKRTPVEVEKEPVTLPPVEVKEEPIVPVKKISANPRCPHCSSLARKIGHGGGKQRYRCNTCDKSFTGEVDDLHAITTWISGIGFEGADLKTGIMLGSLPFSEVDAPSLAEFNGYAVSECQAFLNRAEAVGLVVQKDRSFRAEWLDEIAENSERATVGFIMDVFVLLGKATFKATDDGMLYTMADN